MRHGNKKRKFGREKDARRALMKSLAVNLIRAGKIKTTQAKAKALRSFVEKFVTKAKTGGLANRKIVISKIGGIPTKKLFDEIAKKYASRNGGYTRVVKLPRRQSDGSEMAAIEFV